MSEVASVGTGNFESEVVQSNKAVVVDFWAEWCPPCKMLAPVLDKVARQYAGRVKFVKVDTDAYEEVGLRFGVGKIPNLTYFKNGQVVNQTIGYMNETMLAEKVEEVLNS
jgi:thioredoxin 1